MGRISHRTGERGGIDEQELRRRYYERLSDWSEPDAIKINRTGKLLEPVSALRKWIFQLPWTRPKR